MLLLVEVLFFFFFLSGFCCLARVWVRFNLTEDWLKEKWPLEELELCTGFSVSTSFFLRR